MDLRRFINAVYAYVMKGRSSSERDTLNGVLLEKRWEDMTMAERQRAERKALAIQTGAYQGQSSIVGAMGLPQGRRR